jgi:hypothetical protein
MSSDAMIFLGFFGVIFVLRIAAATIFFYFILPKGDRCPNCDTPTLRVQSKWWNRLVPFLRTSWCIACGWEGMLRHGTVTPHAPTPAELTKKG